MKKSYSKRQSVIAKRISNDALINWRDWRWQVRNSVRDADTVERVLGIRFPVQEKKKIKKTLDKFPLAVTPYYLSLIDTASYKNDPIYKQSIPDIRELEVIPEDMKDPLAEEVDSQGGGIITHRYPDRVLFLVSNMCAMYCRHCTRKRRVGDVDYLPSKKQIEEGLRYIRKTPAIRDVLLSGGDPLMLPDERLDWILSSLRKIPHVEIIRIGTRMPVVLPYRVTGTLVEILKKYHPVWVNTHFNHPREITASSRESLAKMADAGIPLGNQTVLLSEVNDCPRIMQRLCHRLVQNRVRPYYLYQCDLSEGLNHFRTPVGKGIEIIESMIGHTSGFAVPRYVIDAPGGGGKIPILPNYIISWSTNKIVLRNYEGVITTYKEPDSYKPIFCDRNCAVCKLQLNLEGAEEWNPTGIGKLLSNYDKTISLTPGHTERIKRRNAKNGSAETLKKK